MPQPIVDNVAQGNAGSTGTGLSWNHTIGAGVTLVIVFVTLEWFNNPSQGYTGVTFNGQAMTLIDSNSANATHPIWCQMWALWTSIPGAGTYTINCTGDTPNSNSRVGVSASFFSTKPQAQDANISHGFSTTSPVSQTLTTKANKNLVVVGFGSQNGGGATPGGNQTELEQIWNIAGEQSLADLSYEIVFGPQSVTVSESMSNPEDEVIIAASFPIQELISGVMI